MKLGAIRGTLGVPGSRWISSNLSGSRLFTARYDLTPGAITNLGRARQRDPCRPNPRYPLGYRSSIERRRSLYFFISQVVAKEPGGSPAAGPLRRRDNLARYSNKLDAKLGW